MKSLKFCFIFLICLVAGVGVKTHAQGFIPQEIRMLTVSGSYDSGSTQEIGIVSSKRPIRVNSQYEYGVAREIKNGFITSFEILSTEVVPVKDQVRLSVKIPNTLGASATSSYVVYVKSFVKNEPESENFFVTNAFNITANEKPFVVIRNINLLQSNGQRFALNDGPTIYDELISSSSVSTSTSIEVTFESNTETVLRPSIEFSKIRSSVVAPEHTPNDILIKKGTNYFTIPLPTFSYEPGVYKGKLQFRNQLISNEVDFQYIIAGETASVGLVTPAPEGLFTFQVFGTPLDVYGSSTVSVSAEIHTVKTIFKLGGTDIYSTSTKVNFASSSFEVQLPSQIKNIDTVYVEVVSNTTGKTLFVGEKSVSFSTVDKTNTLYVYYVLFLLLLMAFAYKRQAKKFLIVLVLFAMFVFGQRILAATWNPYGNSPSYLINAAGVNYKAENYGAILQIYFNENISSAAKTFTCSEPLTFMFKVEYIQCANSAAGVKVGFATTSLAAAEAAEQLISANNDGQTLESKVYAANYGVHYFYKNTSTFKQYTGSVLGSNVTNLYVSVRSALTDPANIDAGYTRYSIPLSVSACTACSNAPTTSNVPNFQLYGRKYYFSAADQKLYFRDVSDVSPSPASCGVDMCSDTMATESTFPTGLGWNPSPGTYSTSTNRYSCVPTAVNCECSGRDRICTNTSSGTTTTQTNHPTCLLQGFCSTTYQDINSGTMVFDAVNKLGTISIITGGQLSSPQIVVSSIPKDGYTITRDIIDSYDGKTTSVSCTLNYKGGNPPTGSGIIRFYTSPKLVIEGSVCRFGWETKNMQSCRISDGINSPVDVPLNVEAGDITGYVATSTSNKNVKRTLTCLSKPSVESGPVQVYSTSTTCFVNPRIREN